MKTKKTKKNIANTESNKEMLTKYARKREKEETETEDGEALSIKPKKKKASLVNIKHKRVLDNAFKNLRKSKKPSLYQAMLDAGYSPSYAKSCTQLTETKNWQALTEKYLPDNLLITTHGDLMIASKLDYMLFTPDIKDDEIYDLLISKGLMVKKIVHGVAGTHVWFYSPDNKIRKDATELGYKVKGKMSPEVIKLETGLSAMSDAELAELIRKQKNKFTKND